MGDMDDDKLKLRIGNEGAYVEGDGLRISSREPGDGVIRSNAAVELSWKPTQYRCPKGHETFGAHVYSLKRDSALHFFCPDCYGEWMSTTFPTAEVKDE